MPFRTLNKKQSVADNPVDFFLNLRPRKIASLYDAQAQILRDYHEKALSRHDVAIQTATGGGKTLLGLVLCEWRRLKMNERSLYLCPTRQLVHQVTNFGTQRLGMSAYAFVGSHIDYPLEQKEAWRSGEISAITTYKALFNTNPFFERPNFIVVDDAHAADQYIDEFWTLRISRRVQNEISIFDSLTAVLKPLISPLDFERMFDDSRNPIDQTWVELVFGPLFYDVADEISKVLTNTEEHSDLFFRWQMLRGHLHACQVYISPLELVIKPIVPPTSTHLPFSRAKQRVYMSATLGRGGELERTSGRRSIFRLKPPPGCDEVSVGRRFFLFPGSSFSESDIQKFVKKLVLQTKPKRALVLTPSDISAKKFRSWVNTELENFVVFDARQIERSKKPFTEEAKAIAVVANRYDGIDFPDDDCRLLIIGNRPKGMNLQERYLASKLGATILSAERNRTRIIQALGRCTRSATDYAVVCILGEKLADELTLKDYRSQFDPQLQADLEFGHVQSKESDMPTLLERVRAFLLQNEDWKTAENEILSSKSEMVEIVPAYLDKIDATAGYEIEYVQSVWNSDFASALVAAENALQILEGGDDTKDYRGWWLYLAGCASYLLSVENSYFSNQAQDFFVRARKTCRIKIPSNFLMKQNTETEKLVDIDNRNISNMQSKLLELGLDYPTQYVKFQKKIQQGLDQNKSNVFEQAHKDLGTLLGFNSSNPKGEGAPDAIWIVDDTLCFVFEDHIKKCTGQQIKLDKARQADGHRKWVKKHMASTLLESAEIFSVLITNADVSHQSRQDVLEGNCVWPLNEFRDWKNEVLKSIRTLRASLASTNDLFWLTEAKNILQEVHATPTSLKSYLNCIKI